MDFTSDILKIRQFISNLNNSVDNTLVKNSADNALVKNSADNTLVKNSVDKESIDNTLVKESVDKSGNNYQLNQYQFKQNCLNYKRNLNKKIHETKIIDTTEEMIEFLNNNDYKKNWNKLDCYQKKTKIKEFMSNNKENSINYLELFLNKKIINKNIIYDKEKKQITSINLP